MPSNLPKEKFKIATKHLKTYKTTLWYLFWKGKNFIDGDTLYFNLWLININENKYPVTFNYKTKINVTAHSAKSSKYVLGSIYDYQGNIVNCPEVNTKGLSRIETFLNNNDLNDKGFYNLLKGSSNYPLIDYKHEELKNVLFYKKKIIVKEKETNIIVPSQLINDFFFFSFSTKLNNLIISGSIIECVNYIGRKNINGIETGIISQNRLEIGKKETLYYGRYFFTDNDAGLEAINQLRKEHLFQFKKGEKKVYFSSKIPFDFDINFNLIGQYIDSSNFLANRIVGIDSNNLSFFNIDNLIISVLNDTRSAKNYDNNMSVKSKNLTINKFTKIEENNDYRNSDQTSEIYPIIEEQPKDYSFYHTPKNEVVPKESNKNKYILKQIIGGKEYTGGSVNILGDTKEPGVTKTNIELCLYDLIQWNNFIIKTLIEICDEKGYNGHFIKLSSVKEEICYTQYKRKINLDVLSATPYGSKFFFKFILFKINFNQKNYYYFDKGAGTHSCFFSDIYHSDIESSRLTNFIRKMIVNENLRWSKARKYDKFKPDGIIIYQPIEHKENNLKIRLLKRLDFNS
ncbi:hypothetical protein ACQY1Q_12080 [Tenacibaculum sp. TC6]|uniref:hypothetical protein n=1 Tax=Tenacibaculum sp. TC6 TaxID=3423223 RepID=UPI003D3605FA